MSRMELDEEMDERLSESRRLLERAFYVALGSYIEQEAKKLDGWRDVEFGKLYSHLRHEIEEIKRSKTLTQQIHNAIDAVMLSTMLLARLLEKEVKER